MSDKLWCLCEECDTYFDVTEHKEQIKCKDYFLYLTCPHCGKETPTGDNCHPEPNYRFPPYGDQQKQDA